MATLQRLVTSYVGANAGTITGPDGRTYAIGGSIPYTELIAEGCFQESITPDMTSAVKTVDVAWARRREFLVTMRGATFPVRVASVVPGIGLFSSTTRNPPYIGLWRAPPQAYSLDYPSLYCTGADLLMAYGGPTVTTPTATATQDAGDAVFQTARYRLTFTNLPYEVSHRDPASYNTNHYLIVGTGLELKRFVVREVHHAADSIPVPSGAFKWVGTTQSIQEGGVPKIFPTRQISWKWMNLPESCLPRLRQRIARAFGCVNQFDFDVNPARGMTGYPAGTLLLIGADEEPGGRNDATPFAFAHRMYNVKLTALYRNNGNSGGQSPTYYGWNYLYRGPGSTPQFQLVTHNGSTIAGGGVPIYGSYDYAYLFSVDNSNRGM